MKRLFPYIAMIVIFFVLTRCDVQMYSESRAKYMEKNVDKIKINMTKQELRDMFGRPDDYEGRALFLYDERGLEKATSWLYLYLNNDLAHRIDFDLHTNRVIKAEKQNHQ